MEKEKLMQQEIEEKRKLTKNIKDKIDNFANYNFVLAVFIMVYMMIINISYIKIDSESFKYEMKYICIFLTTIVLIFFEIAYKKNSSKYTITAIELLVLDIVVLYIPYAYIHTNVIIRKLVMLVPIYFGVYYSIKNSIIYKKEDIKHKNNLSDVKEILSNKERLEK